MRVELKRSPHSNYKPMYHAWHGNMVAVGKTKTDAVNNLNKRLSKVKPDKVNNFMGVI